VSSDSTPTKPMSESDLASERSTIGRYEIQRVLGRGGMGVVVAARDPELDRMVAVKIISDPGSSTETLGAALRREAQALAKVTHPNVVSVYDAGVDGSPYLVMQLVDGVTLGDFLATRKTDAPGAIVALFLQAARGLSAIHAANLLHRDFKPSNALVDATGTVRVSDLGLAGLGSDTIAGTPAYMAPEQREPGDKIRELTPACDQYSFCVALWEALFGARPSSADVEAPSGRISARQLAALRRGLAEDPAARHPSMDALIAGLTPPSRTPLVAGGAVALLAGGVIAFVATRDGDPPPPPPPPPPAAAFAIQDARRLTFTDACDEYPVIGVDGTVYFDAVVGPDSHLMALAPGAKVPRELTTTKGWDLAPAVSPDGKHLAFLRRTSTPMVAMVADLPELANPRSLVLGGTRPTWSPDGKYVWAGHRKTLARYDAATGAKDRELVLPEGAFPMTAIELHDGRVVVLTKTGSANADGVALYAAGASTHTWLVTGSDDTPLDEVLVLAPDGAAVLVSRLTATGGNEIWRLPLDGKPWSVVPGGSLISARKRLAIHGPRLVWSDCTELGTIATLTAPGGVTKFDDLARNKWFDFSPAALPGTSEFVFLSYRSTKDEIWRGSRTSTPHVVPFGELELDRIVVSHDGKLIAGSNDAGLYVGAIDGAAPRKLLDGAPGTEMGATFSRDNTKLAFESRDGKLDRIAEIPVTGGEPVWIVPAPSLAPAQSPTADVLAYLAGEPAKGRVVMLLDRRTGKTRQVAPALPPYPYRDLRFSPDGKKLLAARRDGQIIELDATTGATLRTFDVGSDQLLGMTYAGEDILVGRATSAGDIWEAVLARE